MHNLWFAYMISMVVPHERCEVDVSLFSQLIIHSLLINYVVTQRIDRLSMWILILHSYSTSILLPTRYYLVRSYKLISIFSQLYCPCVVDRLNNNCDHVSDLMLSPINMGETYFKPYNYQDLL